MKVFFIGQKGIPVISGGVEHYVDNLTTRLAKQGHDVFVYTRPNYGNGKKKIYKGVNLISLPSIPTKNLDTITHTLLATIHILFRKVDVVHFHSIGPSSLLWLVKLFKPNTAVLATFQSQCYRHKKWSIFARMFLKLGESILCHFADEVIVPSKILSYYTEHRYQREPTYIPNGVSLPTKQPAQIIRKWNLKKDNYILHVGRLVRHKAVHDLIEAYKKINSNKKLVIVGDGFYTAQYVRELKEMASDNKNIIFTGEQSNRTLNELYSNAYCFVQPSESEGLSIALLEAMSYGLPVLVSDIAENKEAINSTGYTFKNKDALDLAKKLNYFISHSQTIKNKGRKAKERVKKYYNWDKLVNEIAEVYKQVIFAKQGRFVSRKIAYQAR